MTKEKVIEIIERYKISDPASLYELDTNLALDMAIGALEEIDRLKAEKTKAFDYLFSKFAGHSNYHGDSVLCAIEAVKEGKKIETVKTMDEDGEQE